MRISSINLITISLIWALCSCNGVKEQDPVFMENLPYYVENLEVFGLNQEPGRAFHIPERNISLNGTWKFNLYENPLEVPKNFYKSVIKLDKNFHIYVHGSRQLIEQGEDEHGKFYKLYFNEES